MISIISVNKKGNRIISYTCSDGAKTMNLTKEHVARLIDMGQVCNAAKQNYKGSIIIRVHPTTTRKQNRQEADTAQGKVDTRESQIDKKNRLAQLKIMMGSAEKIEMADGSSIMIAVVDDIRTIFIPNSCKTLESKSNEHWFELVPYAKVRTTRIVGGGGLVSTKSMFEGCFMTSESMDLTLLDTHNVTDMTDMFRYCSMKDIDLSPLNTSNVTNMRGMFYGCKAHSLNIKSFDTRNVKDMSFMFCNCEVKELDLSHFDTSNVEDMEYMFHKCKSNIINIESFRMKEEIRTASMFTENMFTGCNAEIRVRSKRLTQIIEKQA